MNAKYIGVNKCNKRLLNLVLSKFSLLLLMFLAGCAVAQQRHEQNEGGTSQNCQACAESSKFDHSCPLIVAPCNRAGIAQADKVFDDLLSAEKPVVLYVHGRGNEPKKTLKEHILTTLEKDYSVKVLMFNWDSKAPLLQPLHRPVREAQAAAPYLQDVIRRLIKYREAHPETQTVPISLLVHSMGNIVLRKALDGISLSTSKGPLFTNILMTEPDEDAEGHHLWVEKLKAQETILITINKNDGTLKHSNHPNGKTPLGLNSKPPLATNAYYLETTGLVGKVHRLFTKGKQHGRIAICQILSAMLHGDKPVLEVDKTIKRIEQKRVLIPVAEQNKSDKCFQGVIDEPDEDNEESE